MNNPLNLTLDLATIREKIPSFSSEKLCEMIVCTRYFALEPAIIIACMEELSNRRHLGEVFDFEVWIETAYQDLPVLDFSNPDFRTLLSKLTSK
jgi:hypothetical protein